MRLKWTQKITNDTTFSRVDRKETVLQKAMRQKMGLFGHIARMGDDRKLKTVIFGVMEPIMGGGNKRGRPHRGGRHRGLGEDTLHILYHLAKNRDGWRRIINLTFEAYHV